MRNKVELAKLSKRICELRAAKGMSQQQLADEADIDKKTLQRIETSKANPTIDTLTSIAKALKIKLKELVDF